MAEVTVAELLEAGAHIRYERHFGQPWDNGTHLGHDEARSDVTPSDVAEAALHYLQDTPDALPAPCSADDYRQAVDALTDAQRRHGDQCKAAGSSTWKSLLTPPEFHDRALELARSIAAQRHGVGRCGLRLDIGGTGGSTSSSVHCELPAGHDGWHRHGETEWNDRVRTAHDQQEPPD